MIRAIVAILGGVIAASSLIVAKKPNAKDLIDKLVPFQGLIGVLLTIWGVLGVLSIFKHGSIIALLVAGLELVVGFLLAYSLISKYILENNDEAKEKGQALRAKLVQYQVPAGVALAILGVLSIIF
ncbi:hypothetical protein [Tenacibaculum sp. M341]|uniref:hypothetical protein n=1 Tax=Tenacibaculum sp. M341 TaxID=2530339 RepID=UPI0010535D96|nr:hypothetical protein [Tenacibaculum sp. M341]TCI85087.1 hypothetical protein EYW44_18200 [Tenacibaculum sp. M341]